MPQAGAEIFAKRMLAESMLDVAALPKFTRETLALAVDTSVGGHRMAPKLAGAV